ncbi:hypothetical protein M413DRAFT_140963 [Hebeloma cylindrosporum]|uniref:Uncharacterized protein n=1 Tax=Hebeloma cylindrosporum TaxID=76867 RepID=A0A0C3BZA5_HEBCY|nr:hypothetical protein M413DRAFT_140963 [Hebeloma cylindrosporum h7]
MYDQYFLLSQHQSGGGLLLLTFLAFYLPLSGYITPRTQSRLGTVPSMFSMFNTRTYHYNPVKSPTGYLCHRSSHHRLLPVKFELCMSMEVTGRIITNGCHCRDPK